MRFGVFFDFQLPRPWTETSERELFVQALEQAQLADEIGIANLWAQEHHFLEEYSHSGAPEVFLGACSQRTQRIRLGFGIALMAPRYNHPARIAERVAALDLLSGGRVEWGTGESSSRIELEGFGVDYLEKRAAWAEATREAARMMGSEPYAGFDGKYFSMPARNIVPKPLQKPHPPLWIACSNRESIRRAANLGAGALTFAFMNRDEGKFWVDEYEAAFEESCHPIGLAVNPKIAMLTGFMCHPDGGTARRAGLPGLQFFAHGLAHYFRNGSHQPGRTDVWKSFESAVEGRLAGSDGFGSPEEISDAFHAYEEAGVDQLILLQQCGRYAHRDIMASLELFGAKVLPAFNARHGALELAKSKRRAAALAAAEANLRLPQLEAEVPQVVAYQRALENQDRGEAQVGPETKLDAAALWRLHVNRGGRS